MTEQITKEGIFYIGFVAAFRDRILIGYATACVKSSYDLKRNFLKNSRTEPADRGGNHIVAVTIVIKKQSKYKFSVICFMSDHSGKVNLKNRMRGFQRKCHTAGLRMTPQRMAVYKVLAESKERPSAGH